MASALERDATTRRWRRVEYERLVDLGIFVGERPSCSTACSSYVSPTTAALVVEVADTSLRLDRRFKASIYAHAGLREYWIVNLVDRTLEVHRDPRPPEPSDDEWTYRSIEVLRPPASVTPLAAPAARITVADLLP